VVVAKLLPNLPVAPEANEPALPFGGAFQGSVVGPALRRAPLLATASTVTSPLKVFVGKADDDECCIWCDVAEDSELREELPCLWSGTSISGVGARIKSSAMCPKTFSCANLIATRNALRRNGKRAQDA
jgi:hypothetical protein